MNETTDPQDRRCGEPTPNGPCEKQYVHVVPGHWAEPVWADHSKDGA